MLRNYIRCPKCKRFQLIARRLHASWTCPSCHTSIVPRESRKVNEFRVKKFLKKS